MSCYALLTAVLHKIPTQATYRTDNPYVSLRSAPLRVGHARRGPMLNEGATRRVANARCERKPDLRAGTPAQDEVVF